MLLKPKNWEKFQHYKDRLPPWIKLHRELLTDRAFMQLPIASKALAPLLWLLASESKDGTFDASDEELMFRLHVTAKDLQGVQPLIDKGFFIVASPALADCTQVATPETETEREAEKTLSAVEDRFPEFWSLWPKSQRKQAKPKCHQVWKRKSLDAKADAILAHVKVMAASESWRTGFDPAPLTYLNQERWDGAEMDAPQSGSKPWFINGWSGIVAKGIEFGLSESDFQTPPEFRAAVFKAAGITKEVYQKAEADWR